jgi:hypothetical protein
MKAGGTSGEIKEAHQDRQRERERERERNGSSLAWFSVGSSSVASTGNSLERFGLAPSIPPGHRLCAGVEGRRVW